MNPLQRRRLLFLSCFFVVWGLVVVGRLLHIQVVRHESFVQRAAKQQERTISLTPVRGSIYDREGRVLAESIAASSIYADPQSMRDPRLVVKELSSIRALQIDPAELEKRLRRGGEFAWIARQVSPEVVEQVKGLRLSGVYFLEEHKRLYPKESLAASLIGYAGVDGTGLAGVEHSFDRYVRGRPGTVTLLRDARRGVYMVGGEGTHAAVDGNDVHLTIDQVIQFLAERSLEKAVRRSGALGGSIIVADPAGGSILAMASYPGFDPNRFRDFPPASWRNRAVQDLYEPGSTFKIVTAAAGLERDLVTPSQMLDCGNGKIEIANVTIREHDGKQYSFLSFEDVIAQSSNVGTIRVALSLGPRLFYEYIKRFGFGDRTGIELPGEAAGILRRPEKWSLISNAELSIGQEIGVTALQLLRAMSIVANGGRDMKPSVLSKVVDRKGKTIATREPLPPRRVISERAAAILNEILKTVVTRGTGSLAALDEHVVAGKTGTSQKAGRGGYLADRYVASFAGYVPADRPRLVIVVVIDEPRGQHYGGIIAAPAFREVAEASLRYLGVRPSVPGRMISGDSLAAFSQRNQTRPTRRETPDGSEKTANGLVPDLRGFDAREAISKATRQGFEVRMEGSGVVTGQTPLPGAAAAEKTLELTLSSGAGSR